MPVAIVGVAAGAQKPALAGAKAGAERAALTRAGRFRSRAAARARIAAQLLIRAQGNKPHLGTAVIIYLKLRFQCGLPSSKTVVIFALGDRVCICGYNYSFIHHWTTKKNCKITMALMHK